MYIGLATIEATEAHSLLCLMICVARFMDLFTVCGFGGRKLSVDGSGPNVDFSAYC